VAKVDASEILSEARYRLGIVVLFAALFIVLAASVTAYGYRYRQVGLYRDLYRSEREQRAALSEFRTTLYSIGDAVITTDMGGLVKQMNPVAERLTGWQEAEARGKSMGEVFRIVNEETRAKVEDPVARVLREGLVVGLANHTLLIAKDGSQRPIADSGAPICDESGAITGVVLVFQDQTQSQRRLDERETRLTLLQLLNEQDDTHEMIKRFSKVVSDCVLASFRRTSESSRTWVSAFAGTTGMCHSERTLEKCYSPPARRPASGGTNNLQRSFCTIRNQFWQSL